MHKCPGPKTKNIIRHAGIFFFWKTELFPLYHVKQDLSLEMYTNVYFNSIAIVYFTFINSKHLVNIDQDITCSPDKPRGQFTYCCCDDVAALFTDAIVA